MLHSARPKFSSCTSKSSNKSKKTHLTLKLSYKNLSKRSLQATRHVSTKVNSNNNLDNDVVINGRRYTKPEHGKTYVGICFDGTNMEYVNAAIEMGKMPNLKHITSPPDFETVQKLWKIQKEDQGDEAVDGIGKKINKKVNFFQAQGVIGLAASAFPTFTNPNNVSIITGVSPLFHGICGNYYYNEAENKNVTMTDPKLIKSDNILATMHKLDPDNTRITIITSKDKLKRMLLHQLGDNYQGNELPSIHINDNAHASTNACTNAAAQQQSKNIRAISIEALNVFPELGQPYVDLVDKTFNPHIKANGTSTPDGFAPTQHALHNSKAPSIYQPSNSSYALKLGYSLFKRDQAEGFTGANVFYLSTTDYVQHLYAPGTAEANSLMAEFDHVIGRFHDDGALIGFTADHGMNEKATFNGEPNVVFLASELDSIGIKSRVILPITDPYVAHHGALGGYATIYIEGDSNAITAPLNDTITKAYNHLRQIKGCYSVIGREDAVRGLDLPIDRIGNIVVLGDKQSVFGTRPEEHDLTQLHGKVLRSHGSLEESLVPLCFNRPLKRFFAKDFGKGNVRNFDLFYGLFSELDDGNDDSY